MPKKNLTNNSNLGLTMSLWLARDTYDHDPEDAPQDDLPIVSVTQLLKPTKALILGHRVEVEDAPTDLQDLAARVLGQSVHQAIEDSLNATDRAEILESLKIPAKVAAKIRINPTAEEIAADPEIIPVYAERRAYRKITASNGREVWISGKFDQVVNGQVEDNKTVPVYKYMKMDNSEKSDFALQQGIYRWLSPEIITSDMGKINFIFKDWTKGEAGRIPGYPPTPVFEMPIQLMDLKTTEGFIRRKLDEILLTAGMEHEADMPRCKDEELWKSPDVHKYYKNAETAAAGGRSTKNFDTYPEAMQYKASQGGVGVVKIVAGEVRRCTYCEAAPLCTQRLEYQTD